MSLLYWVALLGVVLLVVTIICMALGLILLVNLIIYVVRRVKYGRKDRR